MYCVIIKRLGICATLFMLTLYESHAASNVKHNKNVMNKRKVNANNKQPAADRSIGTYQDGLNLLQVVSNVKDYKGSLANAVDEGYKTNPEFLESMFKSRGAIEGVIKARSVFLPTIEASNSTNKRWQDKVAGGITNDMGVTLRQNLFRSGADIAGINATKHSFLSARSSLKSNVQDLISKIKDVYIAVPILRSVQKVQQELYKRLNKLLDAERTMIATGSRPPYGISVIEAEVVRAEAGLVKITGDLETQEVKFENIVGYLPIHRGLPKIDQSLIPHTIEELVEVMRNNNPKIKSAYENFLSKRAKLSADTAAKFGLKVDLEASTGYNKKLTSPERFDSMEWTQRADVGIRATLPIFSGGRGSAERRESALEVEAAWEAYRKTLREVTIAAKQAWYAYKSALAVSVYNIAQVKAQEKNTQALAFQEQTGTESIVNVIRAEEKFFEAQNSYLDNKQKLYTSYYELIGIMGKLTPELFGIQEHDLKEQYTKNRMQLEFADFGYDKFSQNREDRNG